MVAKILLTIMLFTNLVLSQTVYEIPFASNGNSIELTVANVSGTKIGNVNIELKESPEWINFTKTKSDLETIEGNTEKTALFTFSLGKEAPVGKETFLKFLVSGNNEKISEIEIKITVLPPDNFELFQNYPNPFNPTTKIKFTIPNVETPNRESLQTKLIVYDILGREIKSLINKTMLPGKYDIEFHGSELSSGIYFYVLETGTERLKRKMILLK
ncbi:MAG: T9SS type A sorting domain-containing protein [Melioribacteraceae bacterium]|nr:T9SS type A sorting domain-containing protein [Melioribacteraceae bacterium]